MGYRNQMEDGSPQPVKPVRGYHFTTGGDLNKIILVTDPTCECPEGYINVKSFLQKWIILKYQNIFIF